MRLLLLLPLLPAFALLRIMIAKASAVRVVFEAPEAWDVILESLSAFPPSMLLAVTCTDSGAGG